MTPRRAGWLAGGILFVVYAATLAPGVTFWDAGEFIAAAHSLGIPHPPGTPLFIVLLNVWARLFAFLPFAAATNLLSAVCTACAFGLAAAWLMRSLPKNEMSPWASIAGAVTAGAMTSVWLNATETEVYAASLLLAIAGIVSADRAGRTSSARWRLLAAYLFALAVPLHLSALVAAPAAIVLATQPQSGELDWSAGLLLGGVVIATAGLARLSSLLIAIGVIVTCIAAALPRGTRRSIGETAMTLLVMVVAWSAVAFMLLRARHDPGINQGNPSTIAELGAVISRRQYDVPGLWPRRAPVYLQIANWFEYADWQFALSLAPSVIPNVARVAFTVVYAALGFVGARWHRSVDRRTWIAVTVLFVCGSLGVIGYLNLKVGTSFAWSFVPDAAQHEARDRDYFFVLGFVAWGLWAGMGSVHVCQKFLATTLGEYGPFVGVALAALPIALNWSASSRRSEPEADLPRAVAHQLLDSLPRHAVLFVAGDNDTYPLWYVQQVEGHRRDVTVVTMPLLEAPWYVRELERRDRFPIAGKETEATGIAAEVAMAARRLGRPIAVALTVPKADRNRLGGAWMDRGVFAEELPGVAISQQEGSRVIEVDTAAVASAASSVERWLKGRVVRSSVDPVDEYMSSVLSCPRLALEKRPSAPQLVSLDSVCNLR